MLYRAHRSLHILSQRVLRSSPDIFRERVYMYNGIMDNPYINLFRLHLCLPFIFFFLFFSSKLEYVNSILNAKKRMQLKENCICTECFSFNISAKILRYDGFKRIFDFLKISTYSFFFLHFIHFLNFFLNYFFLL